MTELETDCLRRHLRAANTFLEFGCGGSTLLAVHSRVKRVFSVESDIAWIERLKQYPAIRDAIQANRLNFVCPDLGAVGAWGRPIDLEKRANWHLYHSAVWRRLDATKIDVVLADGRFRIACALQAALRVRDDCPILIHDFWNRSRYHVLLDCLTAVERINSLGVFQVKKPRQNSRLLNLLFAHISNPK